MNTDHVVAGVSTTALHSAISTIVHYKWQVDVEIAQAFSILGLSTLGGLGGLVQWLYNHIPASAFVAQQPTTNVPTNTP